MFFRCFAKEIKSTEGRTEEKLRFKGDRDSFVCIFPCFGLVLSGAGNMSMACQEGRHQNIGWAEMNQKHHLLFFSQAICCIIVLFLASKTTTWKSKLLEHAG